MSPATALPWLLLMLGACPESVAWSRGRDLSADTWKDACEEWQGWLRSKLRGYVHGYGHGYCYGSGYGHGYCSGDGYGDGYSDGDGYGDGYGDGDGDGYGFGNGYGSGSGHGYCSGDGYGYGYGCFGEQTWLDVVTLAFDDGIRLDGDMRAAAIGLIGARLAEIEA